MQTTALGMWDELEKEAGVKLLTPNGLLFYGETDTGERVKEWSCCFCSALCMHTHGSIKSCTRPFAEHRRDGGRQRAWCAGDVS